MISGEIKRKTVETFGHQPGDTGSTEVQVALLTARLTEITPPKTEVRHPVGWVYISDLWVVSRFEI